MQGVACVRRMALIIAAAASLAACASVDRGPAPVRPRRQRLKVGQPYQVNGIWYMPREQPNYDEVGVASWYGDAFHMKATANGEIFDMDAVSGGAHHPAAALAGRGHQPGERPQAAWCGSTIAGPSSTTASSTCRREAARELGYDRQGLARVRVRYVGPAPLLGPRRRRAHGERRAAVPARAALRPAQRRPPVAASRDRRVSRQRCARAASPQPRCLPPLPATTGRRSGAFAPSRARAYPHPGRRLQPGGQRRARRDASWPPIGPRGDRAHRAATASRSIAWCCPGPQTSCRPTACASRWPTRASPTPGACGPF